jgi:hypothetical protein
VTWRNQERTGKRHVTFLSGLARNVENVRHCDLDLYQWCPRCKRPQLFAEVKSTLVSRWQWEQTRRHAAYYGHGCLAILVVEGQGSIGCVVYDSADGSISDPDWTGEAYLTSVLERARDIHKCW